MKVFLTGGTGFVGTYILRALLAEGHEVRCLLRSRGASKLRVINERIEAVEGSITEPHSLADKLAGCDAVIHLVGIIDEHPSRGVTFETVHYQGAVNVADEARRAGVGTFILMSANGARADGVSAYQTTKWRAEEYIRGSGFAHWTIFRPTIIFGRPEPGQPEFASRLATTLIKPFPILPVFGDGKYQLQPVSIEEVAAAFVQALSLPSAHGRLYCVAGKQVLSYLEVLDIITRALGRQPKPKIHQPIWLVRPVVSTLGRVGVLPITPDQFEMLIEGNTCDSASFYRDFDVKTRDFSPENLEYLR